MSVTPRVSISISFWVMITVTVVSSVWFMFFIIFRSRPLIFPVWRRWMPSTSMVTFSLFRRWSWIVWGLWVKFLFREIFAAVVQGTYFCAFFFLLFFVTSRVKSRWGKGFRGKFAVLVFELLNHLKLFFGFIKLLEFSDFFFSFFLNKLRWDSLGRILRW
jgi:hypothetical protein